MFCIEAQLPGRQPPAQDTSVEASHKPVYRDLRMKGPKTALCYFKCFHVAAFYSTRLLLLPLKAFLQSFSALRHPFSKPSPHGYFNANGDRYVRALQPQVFVIPTWDSAHPTVNVLNTLYSKAIYSGNRDVFATSVKQENRIANKKTDDLKSRAGHIVIRVEPGGDTFAVHILSNADESDTLTASFGPYIC